MTDEGEIRPSVLDRLVDHDPDLLHDAPRSASSQLLDLRLSIRRDLEALLNARRPAVSIPQGCPAIGCSLIAYGLPDVSDSRADVVTSRERFRTAIEQTIRTFEPRLTHVRVSIIKNEDHRDRMLRFRIEAVVSRGVQGSIAFDSVLEPASGALSVSRPSV